MNTLCDGKQVPLAYGPSAKEEDGYMIPVYVVVPYEPDANAWIGDAVQAYTPPGATPAPWSTRSDFADLDSQGAAFSSLNAAATALYRRRFPGGAT